MGRCLNKSAPPAWLSPIKGVFEHVYLRRCAPLRHYSACSNYLDRGRHRRKLYNVYPGTRLLAARARGMCLLKYPNRYMFVMSANRYHQYLTHSGVAETAILQYMIGSSILRECLHVRKIFRFVFVLRV